MIPIIYNETVMAQTRAKILLVDDDGSLRTLYTDLLESEGFTVEQAVEGKEGLEKLQKGGYSLALLDILLPGLEGTQILKELKESPSNKPNGPLIMLTNRNEPELLDKCASLGAAGSIIKSEVAPDQFVDKVRSFLNKSK